MSRLTDTKNNSSSRAGQYKTTDSTRIVHVFRTVHVQTRVQRGQYKLVYYVLEYNVIFFYVV